MTRIERAIKDYTKFMFEIHPFVHATAHYTAAHADNKPADVPTSTKFDARGRVPWIIGLVDPLEQKRPLETFPGQDGHGFGFSFLGTLHHNGRAFKYCDPERLKSCQVIALIVDLHTGQISFRVDGVDLGAAFGPDSALWERDPMASMKHSRTISAGNLVPSFSLGVQLVDRSAAGNASRVRTVSRV